MMSCSARARVYARLIAPFAPPVMLGGIANLPGLTLLGIHVLGTLGTFAAAIFRRTLLTSATCALIL
jgi:hypothetical protein